MATLEAYEFSPGGSSLNRSAAGRYKHMPNTRNVAIIDIKRACTSWTEQVRS